MGKVTVEKKTKEKHLKMKEEKMSVLKVKQKRKKVKVKKQTLIPRTRLEPRLTLTSSEKGGKREESLTDIEKSKRLIISLNANEIKEHLEGSKIKETHTCVKPHPTTSTNKQSSKIYNSSNIETSRKNVHNTSLSTIQSNDSEDEADFQNFVAQKRRKQFGLMKGIFWSDREVRDLAYALQSHGFADLKKLADDVKTKSENDIRCLMKPHILEARKAKTKNQETEKQRGRPPNKWTTVSHENLKTWPTIRKWRRLAYEQMLQYTRAKDYSRPVISSLCNRFYEEEQESVDPQVINVKLIYKYLADCMAGEIPPQLPPKESSLVLDLIREVRLMPIAYDFEEERQFLKDFKVATNFKPFEVKDEFKKKLKKEPDEDGYDPHTISVPEEIFLELSRHKRLLQSFNPLVTPVWMLQKEQEHLEKYIEESNVYVD